jgi:hypothetical protein
MARYPQQAADVLVWSEASAATPCPMCGGTGTCSALEHGGFVRCAVVVSDRPVVTGGWLHRIRAGGSRGGPVSVPRPRDGSGDEPGLGPAERERQWARAW